MKKLGFIGAGNMGGAIIKGIKDPDIEIFAYDKFPEKVKALGVKPAESLKELVQSCKYLFLAVKPQQLPELLEEIKPFVTENHVFISICAGVTSDFIKSRTNPQAKAVVAMPNTPAMLGVGACAIARDDKISDEDFSFAVSVMESCGIVREIPMDKMKEIICVNGSSPAFIYLFAKVFVDYAKDCGIDEKAAMDLFAQTLVGSAKMLTDSGMTPSELIKQVSSPGGTTLAGLEKLYEGNFEQTVKKACEACTKRAYEL